jgi:hypothetical protein
MHYLILAIEIYLCGVVASALLYHGAIIYAKENLKGVPIFVIGAIYLMSWVFVLVFLYEIYKAR